jgi:hypothetical protein
MTLSEFLVDKTLTAVEIAESFGLIFNIYIEEVGYGLDTDTSNVPYGTLLSMREDFILENNILSVNGISIDTTTTKMVQYLL